MNQHSPKKMNVGFGNEVVYMGIGVYFNAGIFQYFFIYGKRFIFSQVKISAL